MREVQMPEKVSTIGEPHRIFATPVGTFGVWIVTEDEVPIIAAWVGDSQISAGPLRLFIVIRLLDRAVSSEAKPQYLN